MVCVPERNVLARALAGPRIMFPWHKDKRMYVSFYGGHSWSLVVVVVVSGELHVYGLSKTIDGFSFIASRERERG